MMAVGAAYAAPFPYLFPAQIPPPRHTEATCVGPGGAALDTVNWDRYMVRFAFEGAHGPYLSDKTLTLTDATGKDVVAVSCDAPWVLVRLPPGEYQATANIPGGAIQSRWITIPASGIAQPLVIHFANPAETIPTENAPQGS